MECYYVYFYGIASIKEFSFIPLTAWKCKHAIIKVFNYCICCPNLIYILELLIQLCLVAYRQIKNNNLVIQPSLYEQVIGY